MKTHVVRMPADRLITESLEPNDYLSLLQTTFSGLVQEDLPASPSLGADWTRFMPPDRREGRRGALESAALFCVMMGTAKRSPPPPDLRPAP
jgi:acyl-homoserine lactone synthase